MNDELQKFRVPGFCPICDGMMKGKSTNSYYDWKCCVMCFISFIEGREQRWKDGWRPSPEDIENMHK